VKTVIVVGAGVVGLFCAVRLAQAGARVTLLEAEAEEWSPYGPGASAAAAGMLAPLGEAESPHDTLAFASLDLWKRLRDGAQWADGVRFDGGVVIAETAAHAESFAHRAKRLARSAECLTPANVKRKTGLRSKVEHAVFVEAEGVADPVRVLSGLAMQVRAHGVAMRFNCEVESADATSARAHDGAVFEADAVVLAVGYWGCAKLGATVPALRQIVPGKGQLVPVTLERPLGPNVRAPGFYLAQRREDVVLGATLELGRVDRRANPEGAAELLAAAEAQLPGEVTPAGKGWAGVRPMSPDGWPLIGPSGGVLVAVGHSRNGWLLAPITAEIITAHVFGRHIPPEWAALSPARFGRS